MPVEITIGHSLTFGAAFLNDKQLAEVKKALTLPNPEYVNAVKYGRHTRHIAKELRFYREHGGFLTIPRGFAAEFANLLRFYKIKPLWSDFRVLHPETSFNFMGELRPYQRTAVKHVLKSSQGVLQAGTGAGKTVMALAIIAARRQPTLILVHNKELLNQWATRAKQFLGIEVGQVGGGKFKVEPVTVGIVNTVRNRLTDLLPHFGQVVVDECHRCPSSMFTDCVNSFDAFYRLGLSATPYRRDGLTRAINLFLGPKAHEVDQAFLQDIGAILKPEIRTRRTEFFFHKDGAEHYQELVTALTENETRNQLIAGDVKRELTRDAGTCLVVSDRVAHLEALRAALNALGLDMELLTGKTPKKQREAIVERIQGGEIKIVGSTVQLIGEGFDCPGLSALFLASPIRSSGRLLQVVGRILRPQAGKKPCLYDYLDPVGVLEASARARMKTYERIAG